MTSEVVHLPGEEEPVSPATFAELYKPPLDPLYPDDTDAYTRDIPPVDHLSIPKEYSQGSPDATLRMLGSAQDALRMIETERRRFGLYCSIAYTLCDKYPEAVERLAPEAQAAIRGLALRIHPDSIETES